MKWLLLLVALGVVFYFAGQFWPQVSNSLASS